MVPSFDELHQWTLGAGQLHIASPQVLPDLLGNVLRRNLTAPTQLREVLDDIAHLPDIAGPVVTLQHTHRIGTDNVSPPIFLTGFLQKMIQQKGNI